MTHIATVADDARKLLRAPSRGRRWWIPAILFLICYGLAAAYHVGVWSSQEAPGLGLQLTYAATLGIGYTSLWLAIRRFFSSRSRIVASRAFWTVIVTGIVAIAASAIITRIAHPDFVDTIPLDAQLGFDLQTGIPLVLATVVKMNLIALAQLIFVFVLLIRLQDLVLVKRTRSSQRNWYLMIASMAGVAIFSVLKPAGTDLNLWQLVAIIPAGIFMLVNAFKLSWIVFQSFREKLKTIGLSLVLLVLLVLGVPMFTEGANQLLVPGADAYLEHYSYGLKIFTSQAVMFGILYCTTSFLSLLFHLPTSGDYEQRAGERAAMHSLAHLVGQVFDAANLYNTIVSAPVEAGAADAAWLAVVDPDSGSLTPRVVAAHGIRADEIARMIDSTALLNELQRTGEMLVIDEAAADHRIETAPGDGVSSLLVVPLRARDETLGMLFASKQVSRGFERDDLETVSIFAAQATVAIDNARLLQQKIEKERLARELSIAREVQRRLLPQNTPSLSGLSIAASSVSAQEVGGDYYDFVELDEHRLGIIIADVSGKGTSAAFYMAEMQGIFRSVSRIADTPADFLYHANVALASSLDRNIFISAVYGILDLEREEFRLARAGHCPVATISIGGSARYLRTRGLGLGLDRSGVFRKSLDEEVHSLQPGDVFVLYTDGVVESRNSENEEYGYDRLLQTLEAHRHESADELHASVLRDLRGFLGNEEYDDDLTLLVVKWHGLPSETARPTKIVLEESA